MYSEDLRPPDAGAWKALKKKCLYTKIAVIVMSFMCIIISTFHASYVDKTNTALSQAGLTIDTAGARFDPDKLDYCRWELKILHDWMDSADPSSPGKVHGWQSLVMEFPLEMRVEARKQLGYK
jgi:hypothetical protein